MESSGALKQMEEQFLKNADMKIKEAERQQKVRSEIKHTNQGQSYSVNDYIASKSVGVAAGIILIVYISIFKRKSKVAKLISHIVSFIVLLNISSVIILKYNPDNLFKEVIGLFPIIILVLYFVLKAKIKRGRVYER